MNNNNSWTNAVALGAILVWVFAASPALSAESGEPLHAGERHSFASQAMGETRIYLLHRPKDYDLSTERYPLVVVLDGPDHFHHVSASVDFLANAGRMPRSIVVGIDNTDRFRDLEPPPRGKPAPAVGGPDRLLAYISDELLPHLDKHYRTRPHRTLVGHSAGGLFTFYALLKRADAFKGYIIIAPAFADNREVVKDLGPMLTANKNLRVDLYMTMANERGQMLGGAYEVSSLLQENATRELRWQFRRYPEETHFSVALRSVYDGLQAIYDGWYIHEPAVMFDQGGMQALEKHYAAVSTRVGYSVPIPEDVLLTTHNWLTARDRVPEAEAAAKRALELYPESSDALFALGRLHREKTKDEKQAIAYFSRLLVLDPEWTWIRNMLVEYKVDVDKLSPRLKLPKAELAAYVGRYRSGDAEIAITQRDDQLFADSALGRHEIRAASPTRFYFLNERGHMTFTKNNRGRTDALSVHRDGGDFPYSRVRE